MRDGHSGVYAFPSVSRGGKRVNFVGCVDGVVQLGVSVGLSALVVDIYGFTNKGFWLVNSGFAAIHFKGGDVFCIFWGGSVEGGFVSL